MNLLRCRWLCAVLSVLLTAGCFLALWFCSVSAPDDAVREISIGRPDWYLSEHRVGAETYYTLRSARGDTPWDICYGNSPASLLYFRREGEESLLLQRLDGSIFRIDFCTGRFCEAPMPSEPMEPLQKAFVGT